jgi:AcrR family transcriptional regulator
VEATARVLRDEGYEAANTNRIAEVAGVSVGSLYQYFPGKEALVYAVLERQERRQLQLLAERLTPAAGTDLELLVRSAVQALVDFYREDPQLARVLADQRRQLVGLRALPELERAFVELIGAAIRQQAGQLRPLDIEMATFVIQRAVDALTLEAAVRRPDFLEDGRLAEELVQLIVRYVGISPKHVQTGPAAAE